MSDNYDAYVKELYLETRSLNADINVLDVICLLIAIIGLALACGADIGMVALGFSLLLGIFLILAGISLITRGAGRHPRTVDLIECAKPSPEKATREIPTLREKRHLRLVYTNEAG